MKIYRKREIVEVIEIERETEEDALEAVFDGDGHVDAIVNDEITDAWREK